MFDIWILEILTEAVPDCPRQFSVLRCLQVFLRVCLHQTNCNHVSDLCTCILSLPAAHVHRAFRRKRAGAEEVSEWFHKYSMWPPHSAPNPHLPTHPQFLGQSAGNLWLSSVWSVDSPARSAAEPPCSAAAACRHAGRGGSGAPRPRVCWLEGWRCCTWGHSTCPPLLSKTGKLPADAFWTTGLKDCK